MRHDSDGLFWSDASEQTREVELARIPSATPAPVPETGWRPPTDYPEVRRASALAIDVETFDPELPDKGPGWARGSGHLVGIAVGTPDGLRRYYPLRHSVGAEQNVDVHKTLQWARGEFANARQPKVGANLIYDCGWLAHEGVCVRGPLHDVQYAEALLEESLPVNLDSLGERYLGEGKTTSLLYDWIARTYRNTSAPRKDLHRSPPSLVGPYAEGDVDLPLRVLDRQYARLQGQSLWALYRMECELIPLYLAMRQRGVRVDLAYAEQLRNELLVNEQTAQGKLDTLVGGQVDVNAADNLALACDALGIEYARTAQGQPSFTQHFLEGIDHPFGKLVREVRHQQRLRGTFIESYLFDLHVEGRVHGEFHPLRGDAGGARTGRFSGSNPNLQNIPIRSEYGRKIRKAFVPDTGHRQWRSMDYAQIEYRLLVHHAPGEAGDTVRRHYRCHPDTDYHAYVQNEIKRIVRVVLDRKPLKNINFGLIYGMGLSKLANDLRIPVDEARKLMDSYFESAPYVKPTMDAAKDEIRTHGYVTTVLGRRSRNREEHKALNSRLQGGAADVMKAAMHRCWYSGVFDYVGVPLLTVHDELDFSDPGGVDDGFAEVKRLMETAIPEIKVPLLVDTTIGPSWGDC